MHVTNNVSEKDLSLIAKYLKNPKSDPRIHAARALGAIGPKSKSRLNDLMEAMEIEKDPGAKYSIMSPSAI